VVVFHGSIRHGASWVYSLAETMDTKHKVTWPTPQPSTTWPTPQPSTTWPTTQHKNQRPQLPTSTIWSKIASHIPQTQHKPPWLTTQQHHGPGNTPTSRSVWHSSMTKLTLAFLANTSTSRSTLTWFSSCISLISRTAVGCRPGAQQRQRG